MFEFLKKNLTIIMGLILAWGGYSYLGEEEAKQSSSAKASIDAIGDAFLEVRDPEAEQPRVVDPFRFESLVPEPLPEVALDHEVEQAGGEDAEPGSSDTVAPAQADRETVPARDWRQAFSSALQVVRDAEAGLRRNIQLSMVKAAQVGKQIAAAELRRRARFSIVLESTLTGGGAEQARISGHTVRVGELMPFLDPEDPPLLESVKGSLAVVVHKRDRYVLDLDGRRRIDVGGPPLVAAPTAATGPSSGSAPAAAPSAPKKSNNGYRIRGSNKKKR